MGRKIDPTLNVKEKLADSERLTAARLDHLHELIVIDRAHAKELREAEAKRIDAIRAVDVNAIFVANERAMAQASVLAEQLTQRLSALEKSQSAGSGKSEGTSRSMSVLFAAIGALGVLYSVWAAGHK